MTEFDLRQIETACRARADALRALTEDGDLTTLGMGTLLRLIREIRRLSAERDGRPFTGDPWGDGR